MKYIPSGYGFNSELLEATAFETQWKNFFNSLNVHMHMINLDSHWFFSQDPGLYENWTAIGLFMNEFQNIPKVLKKLVIQVYFHSAL